MLLRAIVRTGVLSAAVALARRIRCKNALSGDSCDRRARAPGYLSYSKASLGTPPTAWASVMLVARNEARVAKARSMMAPQRPLMHRSAAVDCSIVIGIQQVSGYMMT